MTPAETNWTPCPFCKGKYKLVGAPKYMALHTKPACGKYDAIEGALEFAVAARRAAGMPDPDDN